MDNKTLGAILIAVSLLVGGLFYLYHLKVSELADSSCQCGEVDGGFCPHEQASSIEIYGAVALVVALLSLGVYLIFFEKGQKAIFSALEEHKSSRSDEEKFDILLSGLDDYEKKVLKAVREQDGIKQFTLKLRTDLSKTKLSIVLSTLEKKGLIKKIKKGKTNLIYLKKGN